MHCSSAPQIIIIIFSVARVERSSSGSVTMAMTPGLPDDGRALAEVVAELQDAVVERQGDEVALAVVLLAVVEDHAVGVVGQEDHRDADLLPAGGSVRSHPMR